MSSAPFEVFAASLSNLKIFLFLGNEFFIASITVSVPIPRGNRFQLPQTSQAVSAFSSLWQRLHTNILFLPSLEKYKTRGALHSSHKSVLPQSRHTVRVASPLRRANMKVLFL